MVAGEYVVRYFRYSYRNGRGKVDSVGHGGSFVPIWFNIWRFAFRRRLLIRESFNQLVQIRSLEALKGCLAWIGMKRRDRTT
jgi:hypothetical protein